MYMRVSNTQSVYSIYGFNKTNESNRLTRKQESVDSYEISAKAKLYSEIRKAINETPEVREDKVEVIRQKLKDGHNIPSDVLAEKMLSINKTIDKKL